MSFTLIIIIIIITCIISLYAFTNQEFFSKSSFSPFLVVQNKQWQRLITHAFIHADFFHLFVNMYVLYSFGSVVEMLLTGIFGSSYKIYFILLYIGGILFAALPALAKHKNNYNYTAVGASGAVSAVLFSAIIYLPTLPLRLMFIPIDIPAVIFGVLYLAFEYYMDKRSNDHVAHDAHFFGAIYGVLFTIVIHPQTAVDFVYQILEYIS